MQLYKLLRTSLTTVVYYILHAFQIHKNALKKRDRTSVFTIPTFTYSFILLREINWEHQSMISSMDEITMLK